MKSKFAQITDNSIGAVILFAAVTAVFRYYLPLSTSAFCAACVSSCILFLSALKAKRQDSREKLSKAASEMFFDFMFKPQTSPAALLTKGLINKGVPAVRHGDAVYAGRIAAFFCFDAPPTEERIARMTARAKRYGANRLILFCKTTSAAPDIDGFTYQTVTGDDTYKLFHSLGALPEHTYSYKQKRRFGAFAHALDKDKIWRYLVLSASLFGVAAFTGYSAATLICAAVAAALFLSSLTLAIVNEVKRRRKSKAATD